MKIKNKRYLNLVVYVTREFLLKKKKKTERDKIDKNGKFNSFDYIDNFGQI